MEGSLTIPSMSSGLTTYLGNVIDNVLFDLLSRHDQKQAFQIIRSNLVEDNLNVERIFQPQSVMPDRAAEDQIVDCSVPLQF